MMAAMALEFLPLTLTLSPQAGRGDRKGTAYPFSPRAGRRWRQPDEGRKPVSAAARTLWPAGHLPPRGENGCGALGVLTGAPHVQKRLFWSEWPATIRSPRLWGRCPAGQRGVKPPP